MSNLSNIKRHVLSAATAAFILVVCSAGAQAAIFVKIPSLPGDVRAAGYDTNRYFTADSFSFGVEREMKESGEKSSVSLSLALDSGTLALLDTAVAGEMIDGIEIELTAADGEPATYLRYKLERCFIKSWSTSGAADDRPTEQVTLVIEFEAIELSR